MTTRPQISVIIPTLNGGEFAERMVLALHGQSLAPREIIVIDSGSSDNTVRAFVDGGARVVPMARGRFGHASVRNQAAALATGSLLAFLSQDSIPMGSTTLERLVEPIVGLQVEASYARQIPRSDAPPLERFARAWNYPPHSGVCSEPDIARYGIRAVFFSNACSAVRRSTFEAVGGFPDYTIMNEDMLLSRRLLARGHRVAYVADAMVEHSHSYGLAATFRRYFDIGVVFEQAADELRGIAVMGEGRRYAAELLTTLIREHNYHWVPAMVAEGGVKFVATTLGRNYRRLPKTWIPHLSMHPAYWRTE